MSHVSSSAQCEESCLLRSADVCLRCSFRPEDGCRLLSEPTVLECLEVVLCGAMRSRMRLHKFLFFVCVGDNLDVVPPVILSD